MNNRLAFVLGIRPDIIRAALILNQLRARSECDVRFIWSGQHYSDNLKDVFFRELGVGPADIELGCGGETDGAVVASVVSRMYSAFAELDPRAVVFLGDTNTTMGAIAAAQLNIPIVHIEGCMRSYDWRMPEEKYRTIVDHLSDVIYAYFDEYKAQGVREGINPDSIVVVGNPIVDILQHYYFNRRDRFDQMADAAFFADRGLSRGEYYVMTCHRRENVESPEVLRTIVEFLAASPRPVYLPASYRTQRRLADFGLTMPPQVKVVDPVGYEELLCLMVNGAGALTDSGTIVEEACVLNVPSVQMRKATERPQVYDARSSVKFDPADPARYPFAEVFRKLESLRGATWEHNLGDGQTSARIAADLCARMTSDGFRRHKPADYHLPIARSYREDGIEAT